MTSTIINKIRGVTTRLGTAVIASSMLLAVAGQAAADTYAIIVNATETPVSINGSKLESRAGTWSPLDAQIVLGDGSIAEIKDMHLKCADGGWMLMATGKLPTTMCIQLGFAEVGCILAAVSVDKATNLERIDMVKTRGTACSDRWWEVSGKEIIRDTADRIITMGVAAVGALGAAAGG